MPAFERTPEMPLFDLKTDWSKWKVEEFDGWDTYTYRHVRLETPEIGCECCLGYAEWRIEAEGDPAGYGVLQCSNCLMEASNDPGYPGTFKPND